jgi:hypothetical protein
MNSAGSWSDWVAGAATVATGAGMITMVLFPLAIPIVALTIVLLLALALPLIAIAAMAAILVGVWRGIRAAGRGMRRPGAGPERRGSVATGPRPRLGGERIC